LGIYLILSHLLHVS